MIVFDCEVIDRIIAVRSRITRLLPLAFDNHERRSGTGNDLRTDTQTAYADSALRGHKPMLGGRAQRFDYLAAFIGEMQVNEFVSSTAMNRRLGSGRAVPDTLPFRLPRVPVPRNNRVAHTKKTDRRRKPRSLLCFAIANGLLRSVYHHFEKLLERIRDFVNIPKQNFLWNYVVLFEVIPFNLCVQFPKKYFIIFVTTYPETYLISPKGTTDRKDSRRYSTVIIIQVATL